MLASLPPDHSSIAPCPQEVVPRKFVLTYHGPTDLVLRSSICDAGATAAGAIAGAGSGGSAAVAAVRPLGADPWVAPAGRTGVTCPQH